MMVHYRKDENGNIILSEYMFNRLMKSTYNKEKEILRLNTLIDKYDKELTHKTKQYEYLRHGESKELKGSDK